MSYAEIVGVWVDEPGPQADRPTARPIEWARGSDGTVVLRLIDALGEPVVLGDADAVYLDISDSTCNRTLQSLQGAATSEVGRYDFTLTPSTTRPYVAGTLVYDARARIDGKWQQVVQTGYFIVTPIVPG